MVLDVRGLKKTFTKKKFFGMSTSVEALRGVTFSVKKGEIYGFLGPNGAGKTTTVNILSGIVTADSGTVRFFGEEPNEYTRNRMNVATAYNPLNHAMTVFQNLHVFARLYNVKKPKDRIDDVLHMFQVTDLKHREYYMLSAGQKTLILRKMFGMRLRTLERRYCLLLTI
jgi:ABC-2 type transport system ATP-binding protein